MWAYYISAISVNKSNYEELCCISAVIWRMWLVTPFIRNILLFSCRKMFHITNIDLFASKRTREKTKSNISQKLFYFMQNLSLSSSWPEGRGKKRSSRDRSIKDRSSQDKSSWMSSIQDRSSQGIWSQVRTGQVWSRQVKSIWSKSSQDRSSQVGAHQVKLWQVKSIWD